MGVDIEREEKSYQTSEHLEAGGISHVEADVGECCSTHVAERRWPENERVEISVTFHHAVQTSTCLLTLPLLVSEN